MSLSASDRLALETTQAAIDRRRGELSFMANGSRTKPFQAQPVQVRPNNAPESAQVENKSQYPETVAFYAAMGVHAAQRYSGVGGGWRLYVLAKALDKKGLGMIPLNDLRGFSRSLGIKPRTWQRWIEQARECGLVIDIRKGAEAWLRLPNPGTASYAMGAPNVGKRKVEMSVALLVGKGWKARVWAAYEAARGEQISRKQLETITNVPVSTQRYRDNQAGVERQRHYAQSRLKKDSLAMLEDCSKHKGLFVASNGLLYWRLPDSRTTDLATDAGKGRGRKATAKLRYLQGQEETYNGLLKMQQALSDDSILDLDSEYVRLFCLTNAQRKTSERKVARQDSFAVSEIYLKAYENKESGAGIWDVYGQL
jgi:hypothetical protein